MNYYDAGYYDVIVVGAGHAGIEAALAPARMNKKTLLLTLNLESIGFMPCNPSIGGTSKGHLVREIDALGGQMGISADATFIQIKMLNRGKGPAVHSLRAQIDKKQYHLYMKGVLENTPNLDIKMDEVTGLCIENGKISGITTAYGAKIGCKAVILSTGVYLKGRVIIGEYYHESGPAGFLGANELSRDLLNLGFKIQRFKTGTPARVDRRTIDFSKVIPQYGDEDIIPFSFMSGEINRNQVPCYLTYTNERTHEIIRANIHRSPLFSGMIKGTGPRYCPSIEDKVVKFPDRERHQLFIEPEGLNNNEMYIQGMSSSLPEEVQISFYRTIPGLENARFMRTAYAIEYDCIDPTQVKLSLESKSIEGLFFAGQINGSSGYEEAAAQGIMAGINASRFIDGEEPVILGRDQAYIGVLIDDLATKGTNEPYRMMTSRAEYRLILRQDNADMRLTQIGRNIGLVTDERYDRFMYKKDLMERSIRKLESSYASAPIMKKINGEDYSGSNSMLEILRRPEIALRQITSVMEFDEMDSDTMYAIEAEVKYKGYIEKQLRQVEQFRSLENRLLPQGYDYLSISGLSSEGKMKLQDLQPLNIGQASRISGVSPADISVLLIHFEKQRHE
ncbi:MAG: tRNA uridine-5-carboxymethylaminomethyl(34) synthesis enzyme MnmG [Clostridia bacterium]|jgi:tRNA uridine 5-carboxymethylaminomethyl modification enzyme|nr:tRNA uridine-5-carboxymethylaminomethyl(34) synthesis enzyme MnmG [Clostridia bacterium]MBQ5955982.1 tRNA uridine-5-carboxymethylaminomethyl(34) synthesis enzyme MnmG [Clostridia bacterium]